MVEDGIGMGITLLIHLPTGNQTTQICIDTNSGNSHNCWRVQPCLRSFASTTSTMFQMKVTRGLSDHYMLKFPTPNSHEQPFACRTLTLQVLKNDGFLHASPYMQTCRHVCGACWSCCLNWIRDIPNIYSTSYERLMNKSWCFIVKPIHSFQVITEEYHRPILGSIFEAMPPKQKKLTGKKGHEIRLMVQKSGQPVYKYSDI